MNIASWEQIAAADPALYSGSAVTVPQSWASDNTAVDPVDEWNKLVQEQLNRPANPNTLYIGGVPFQPTNIPMLNPLNAMGEVFSWLDFDNVLQKMFMSWPLGEEEKPEMPEKATKNPSTAAIDAMHELMDLLDLPY